MNRSIGALLFVLLVGYSANARAELSVFLGQLNVQARADLHGFGVQVSNQFGVPLPQVHTIIELVESPADAFMCFQLSQMTGLRPESIVQSYRSNRGKGWGVIAQDMGIKPGSAEFHALKRGDFALTGTPGTKAPGKGKDKVKGNAKGAGEADDHGKGKGKGNGHGKGHGK